MPKRISDDELRADLQQVADELGESPTVRQYREHGTYTDSTLRNRFGSWSEALQAAGLDDSGSQRPVPTSQLIDELQDLADELGESPTARQMDDRGPRWHSVYQNRFGSWNEALEAAGLKVHYQTTLPEAADAGASATGPADTETGKTSRTGPIDTEAILASLREVADQLGQPPTGKQFDAKGICSTGTVYKRFESWDAALEAAGLDPDVTRGATQASKSRISDATLVADIRRLADESGESPTLQEYRKHGEYGAQTLYDRFGSWNDALEAAGFNGRDPVSKVPKDDLIAELERLAGDDGAPPTVAEMRRDGEYWVSTYQDRFGSWSDALQAAGFDATPQRTKKYDRAELLDGLHDLASELDERPTQAAMASDGDYSVRAYRAEFGSWSDALQAAGFEPSTGGRKVSEDELLAGIRRLADELDKSPTAREMDADGQYASATYQNRFGTWSAAVEKALDNTEYAP